MTRTYRGNSRFRGFGASAALAAAATAIMSAVGAPVAGADTLDELLMQSESDFAQAGSLYSGIDPSLLSAHDAANQAHVVSSFEGQAGLISTLQAHQDALPETVQTSSQIIGADQQLATASNDLLTATTNLTNAADAGDYATGQAATLSGEITGYFDRLDFAYTEIFQVLPAELNVDFTTEFATFPTIVDPVAPVVADVASSASAASDVTSNVVPPIVTSYPFALLNDAAANLTDANQVLASVPAADTVDFLTPQLDLQTAGLQVISNLDAAQNTIDTYDNGALADLATPFFNSMDQGFASATEAVLTADQGLDAALAGGTGVEAAELTVLAADFGFAGDSFSSLGTDLSSLLF